jgi:hypothetical protein
LAPGSWCPPPSGSEQTYPDEAPRGLAFLNSGNRFNVAISHAGCAAFLVASHALFEVRCKTERQVRLVNAFRRYLEAAIEVAVV